MKTADVVIGANYGDEGKGLMTDYYAELRGGAVVVRFNGGAQAGHTVVTPDNRRHVFSHMGSGSLAGAETFLSRFFVCNPLLFRKEAAVFAKHTQLPVIHVDALAPVTTPYDMMVNQIAEDLRGRARHGSCGMGFGETIERHQHAQLALSYADLNDRTALRLKLAHIRDNWLVKRLAALGFPTLPAVWRERVYSDGLLDKFMEDTDYFLSVTKPAATDFLRTTSKPVIFEGAQGLMLDMARGSFPHVTRSNTGIKNVLPLAAEAGIEALNVTYATRAYLTRHGAGPLDNELQAPPYAGIRDETNVLNDWQGSLRFAWLDARMLARFIRDDLSDNKALKITPGLAVTCLDQTGDEVTFMEGDALKSLPRGGYAPYLQKITGTAYLFESHGPTRATIQTGRKAAA